MANVYVCTIDQVSSRRGRDAVPELLEVLAEFDAVIPFSRTLGDEVQGVLADAATITSVIRRVLRFNNWHIGIGIGPISAAERKLQRSSEATGPSFAAARDAIDAAKRRPGRSQIAVAATVATQPELNHLDALLGLLAGIITARTPSQWKVIDAVLTDPEATQSEIAKQLDMTQQGVAKSLAASLWRQELEVIPLLEALFEQTAAF